MKRQNKVLTVELSVRLPDINSYRNLPAEYEDYGRFAVLNSGNLWNGPIASSHPGTTYEGFYWARCKDTLFLSPRGSTMNWPGIMTDDLIRRLIRKLNLHRRYRNFQIIFD